MRSHLGRAAVAVLALLLAVGAGALTARTTTTPAATSSSAPTRQLTTTVLSLPGAGADRRVILVAPRDPVGALALVLPGYTETPETVRRTSGADVLAATEGVTVAYVEGFHNSWDAGTCCGDAVGQHLDDIATLEGIAAALVARNSLDRRRVFVAGHSNGAFMALTLECSTRAVFAGYLSVAGSVVTSDCGGPDSARLLLWQGGRDTIVPVEGRSILPVALPPLTGTLEPFTAGCPTVPPPATGLDTTTSRTEWTCPGGRVVSLLFDSVGTHDWPGPPGALMLTAWRALQAQRASAGP